MCPGFGVRPLLGAARVIRLVSVRSVDGQSTSATFPKEVQSVFVLTGTG